MRRSRALFFCFLCVISSFLLQAIPHKVELMKKNQFISSGALIGGKTQSEKFLKGASVQRNKKTQMERLVLEFEKNPKDNAVGFYHVEVNSPKKYIMISLEKVIQSKINEAQLARLFVDSPSVQKVIFFYDPVQMTTSIQLKLKSHVQVQSSVKEEKNQGGKIFIDLKKL